MAVAVTINGNSLKGIYLDESSLGQLLTPPPMKDRVQSSSRLEHGIRVVTDDNAYMNYRDFTLNLGVYGKTEAEFLANYGALCDELKTGKVDVGVLGSTYRCIYLSCQQFSQFQRGIGKFVLRLREYNPNNR
ncbi:MAG: hypothetical protein IJ064_05465 [Bacteroidaceae bacterium]|nr:hypothetical protein [Bacteroidaceae bacterium]